MAFLPDFWFPVGMQATVFRVPRSMPMKRALPLLALLLLLTGCTNKGIEVRTRDDAGHYGDPEAAARVDIGALDEPPAAGARIAPVLGQTIQVWLDEHGWDFQPWVAGFRDRIWLNWSVPADYKQGLLSGTTELSVTVGRDGSLAACEVTGKSGTAALDLSSLAAVKAAAPFAALPGDFPRDDLVLTVRLDYPRLARTR